jgi:hypothetical protein
MKNETSHEQLLSSMFTGIRYVLLLLIPTAPDGHKQSAPAPIHDDLGQIFVNNFKLIMHMSLCIFFLTYKYLRVKFQHRLVVYL